MSPVESNRGVHGSRVLQHPFDLLVIVLRLLRRDHSSDRGRSGIDVRMLVSDMPSVPVRLAW